MCVGYQLSYRPENDSCLCLLLLLLLRHHDEEEEKEEEEVEDEEEEEEEEGVSSFGIRTSSDTEATK